MASDGKAKHLETLIHILCTPTNQRSQEEIEMLKPIISNLPLIKNNDILQQSGKEQEVINEL